VTITGLLEFDGLDVPAGFEQAALAARSRDPRWKRCRAEPCLNARPDAATDEVSLLAGLHARPGFGDLSAVGWVTAPTLHARELWVRQPNRSW
jgi:hypothetical protein